MTVSDSLASAIDLMRVNVPVRDEWRNALLREVANNAPPTHGAVSGRENKARTFAVRPAMAIAACAVAMLTGSAGTMLLMNRQQSQSVGTAALPLPAVSPVSNAPTERQTVMRFELVAPGAKHVSIVGDFNGWNPNATPLVMSSNGTTWLVEMPLSNGRHVYAFVVDGDIVADPSAARVVDHDFGSQNSVVLVGGS